MPPSAEAMAKVMRLTALTSTPICCAASRSCAVARKAQPHLVKRRKLYSTSAVPIPMPAISRSIAPIVTPPT